jgi:hypothetical protein
MGDRFTEQVGRVMDLAREEADRLGHRYVGPEHLLLGLLRDGSNRAARILRARGVDLPAARTALGRLADQGVVPGPRPSDAELLATLGIDLDALRRNVEQTFGVQALEQATREAVHARRGGVGRVPRTSVLKGQASEAFPEGSPMTQEGKAISGGGGGSWQPACCLIRTQAPAGSCL